MPYGNALPLADGAGTILPANLFGLDHIIAAAIVGVLFAIAAFRYGSRIGRARKPIFTFVGAVAFGVAFLAHGGGLSWSTSAPVGLAAAVTALYLSSRIVPQERRAVA